MARGYDLSEVKFRLIKLLRDSETGISGVEISERLRINRVTMTKFLNVFSTQGVIGEKNIGNVNLWFVHEGIEQFQFPDDYFRVQEKYIDYITKCSESSVYNLIRSCLTSDVNVTKLMTEVILTAIPEVQKYFDDGKIGKAEEQLMKTIISKSIQLVNLDTQNPKNEKNVIIIAADPQSILEAEAASAAYNSNGWNVFFLGDMSASIDVLFDLELTKLLSKVWKTKQGLMIITVFSQTEEGLKFFSESFYSVKGKNDDNLHLILSGKIGKKIKIKSELQSEKLEDILQWSQTKFENI
jgi:methanogenic corrinoid protein MtbC1